MPFSILRTAAVVAALSLAPAVCTAQEVFGTIKASLDGAERTWFLTAQDDESQSFVLKVAAVHLQSFSLWGVPDEQSVQVIDDSFLLTFDIMSVGDQMIVADASVIYLADGWSSGWIADEPEQIAVSLKTLEKREDGVFVEGSFTATANFSAPLAGGEVDTSRPMAIEGAFTALMPPFSIQGD